MKYYGSFTALQTAQNWDKTRFGPVSYFQANENTKQQGKQGSKRASIFILSFKRNEEAAFLLRLFLFCRTFFFLLFCGRYLALLQRASDWKKYCKQNVDKTFKFYLWSALERSMTPLSCPSKLGGWDKGKENNKIIKWSEWQQQQWQHPAWESEEKFNRKTWTSKFER